VGLAERAAIPRPERIRPGDVLVGLASSGLHSNGFSLVRRVLLERARLKIYSRVPELGCTLADELLRPTKIYAKVAASMFDRFPIRGLANITGGGIVENLPRVLPAGIEAVVRRGSWPVPPIFALIDQFVAGGLAVFGLILASDTPPPSGPTGQSPSVPYSTQSMSR